MLPQQVAEAIRYTIACRQQRRHEWSQPNTSDTKAEREGIAIARIRKYRLRRPI